ncbi:MAG: hypothetical protein LBO80_11980 [Treponema sp.]|jgi:hypothetical protein|nr:hypothetical protein [Treponema sp.]
MNILEQYPEEKPAEASIDILPGVPDRLSAAAAAFVMAVSEQTVIRMIDRGDLLPDMDGTILKDDLVNYVRSHTLSDVPVLDSPEPLEQ